NQFNIWDNNWAPGIPADVGDTDTCANHNVTFTANLLVAERTGGQGNGSRRASSGIVDAGGLAGSSRREGSADERRAVGSRRDVHRRQQQARSSGEGGDAIPPVPAGTAVNGIPLSTGRSACSLLCGGHDPVSTAFRAQHSCLGG